MKKLLTLLLICVAATGWSQNTFKYPVYMLADSNKLVDGAQAGYVITCMDNAGHFEWAAGTSVTLQQSINNSNQLNQDNTIDANGFHFRIDSTFLFAVQTPTYPESLIYADDNGGVTIGDAAGAVNNTEIAINDAASTILYVANEGHTFNGHITPIDSGLFNLGSEGFHFDSLYLDHIKIADGAGANKILTSDADGDAFWQTGSGVYLPDTSDGTDITDFVIDSASYTRVGNVVTVTGYISDISTGISGGTIQLSLPIASNIARVGQLTGTVNIDDAVAGGGSYILGHVANDKAVLTTPPVALSNALLTFAFSYLVY